LYCLLLHTNNSANATIKLLYQLKSYGVAQYSNRQSLTKSKWNKCATQTFHPHKSQMSFNTSCSLWTTARCGVVLCLASQ